MLGRYRNHDKEGEEPNKSMHITKLRKHVSSNLFARVRSLGAMLSASSIAAVALETFYKDRPCMIKPKTEEPAKKTGADIAGDYDKDSPYPLGMDATWFETPEFATETAYCDRLGCDCGSESRNFRRGLNAAVLEALFLEASWHRYEIEVSEMQNGGLSGLEKLQKKFEVEASACDIQMSQLTLKQYADQALVDISEEAAIAKEKGDANKRLCDGGDGEACRAMNAGARLERFMMDLETLRTERKELLAELDL